MSVKLLHSADIHAGLRQYGIKQRELDFYDAARELFRIAFDEKVQAIMLAGDIFDAIKPPGAAVKLMQYLVGQAKGRGIRVLGIDGNHDACNGEWLDVCGIEDVTQTPAILLDGAVEVAVAGIHYTRPSEFLKKLDALKDVRPRVLMIHQAVQELMGFGSEFSLMQLAGPMKAIGVQYCAMGDIHQANYAVMDGVEFRYPGSTEVNDTSEDGPRTCTILTVDSQEIKTHTRTLKTREFVVRRLETDQDVDDILKQVQGPDKPFVLGWFSPEKRDISRRAEAVLASSGAMYRIMPFSGSQASLDIAKKTFERKGATLKLLEAVTAFFEENGPEYQLVFQLLGNPEACKEICSQYLDGTGQQKPSNG